MGPRCAFEEVSIRLLRWSEGDRDRGFVFWCIAQRGLICIMCARHTRRTTLSFFFYLIYRCRDPKNRTAPTLCSGVNYYSLILHGFYMNIGHEILNLKNTSPAMLSFGPLLERSIVLADPLLMDQGTNFESLTSNEIYIHRSEREPDSPSIPR